MAFLLFYWSYSEILCFSAEPCVWIMMKTFLIRIFIDINLQIPLFKIFICEEILLNVKMIINIWLIRLIVGLWIINIFIQIFKSFRCFKHTFARLSLKIDILNWCGLCILKLILSCCDNNLILFFIFCLRITKAVTFSKFLKTAFSHE